MTDSDTKAETETAAAEASTRSDGTVRPDGGTEGSVDRWITGPATLETELPPDVQAALGRVLGEEPFETIADWVGELRRRTDGESITVDQLCHAEEETEHLGEVGDETYHFRCFYDAVVLSSLVDRPVEIRTVTPDGTAIEARAVGTDGLTVAPDEAVFSFGVDEDVVPPVDGEPTPADVYASVCPYVRAFPDREAYERWVPTVPAATVAMPLAGATELAAELLR